MPEWVQWVIAAAALVTAMGVLWTKVLHPGAKLVSLLEEMLPVGKELTVAFRSSPGAFKVLNEVAAQFRTDSGSSLKDAIDRLEEMLEEVQATAEGLKGKLATDRALAERDRQEIQRAILMLDRLATKVDAGSATSTRIETAAGEDRVVVRGVADDLAAAQTAVEGVASDLADAHRRADEVEHGGSPGQAADAASRQTPEERELP